MQDLFIQLLNKKKIKRMSPDERARIAFENHARAQFKRLKDKGLGITIFSL